MKAAKATIFLATSFAESARNFYEEKLGLTLASGEPYALVYFNAEQGIWRQKYDDSESHAIDCYSRVLSNLLSRLQAAMRGLLAFGGRLARR